MTFLITANDLPQAIAVQIEKLGSSTSPEQVLRELVHNAIQACQNRVAQEPEMKGKVRVEITQDKHEWETRGVRCLRVADNGIGMTSKQFEQNMTKLFSSGQRQSALDNFGIGAKVAGLYHSPMGLRYASWTDEESMMATLYRDADGKYGLKEDYDRAIDQDSPWIQEPTGSICDESMCIFQEITTSELPNGSFRQYSFGQVKPKGTCVTVLGKHENHNTYLSLKDSQKEKQTGAWAMVFLSSRYFRLPKDVLILYYADIQQRNRAHKIIDAESTYASSAVSTSSGSVSLNGATVHWSIASETYNNCGASMYALQNRFAFVFQNECVMMSASRYVPHLKKYGIHAGAKRVRLFVEVLLPDVEWDASRTTLIRKNGQELPEEEWEKEFASKMPDELKQFMEAEFAKMASVDPDEIRKRLQSLPWAHTPRFRPSKDGNEQADDFAGPKVNPGDATSDGSAGNGPTNPPINNPVDNGINARNIGENVNVPRMHWTKPSEDHPELHNNIASYEKGSPKTPGTLLFNEENEQYKTLRKAFCQEFSHVPAKKVDATLRNLISTGILCVIIGFRKEGQGKVPSNERDKLLHPRALTAALFGNMWCLHAQMREELRKSR